MERLTFDGNFCDIARCRELPCQYNTACTRRQVWEKLKAYEDTGLTPKLVQETAEFAIWIYENGLEKIKEWIKADKDGRLVVLPEGGESIGGDEMNRLWNYCSFCGKRIETGEKCYGLPNGESVCTDCCVAENEGAADAEKEKLEVHDDDKR